MSKPTLGKRLLKYLFYGVLNLVVLIVAAIILVPILVDEDDIKAQITETVQARTGREMQLRGPLNISVFPWLGVELNDVAFSNAQGYEGDTFASLKHAQVRIELIPLTRRELRMDTVTLSGLELKLERKADGSSNWDDLTRAGADPSDDAGSDKTDLLAVFALGGVDVKDARIEFRDALQQVQLSNLSVNTGPVSLTKPIDVQLSTHFDSTGEQQDNNLKGQLQIKTRVAFELAAKRYQFKDLNADLKLAHKALGQTPAELGLNGTVTFDQNAGVLTAQGLKLKLKSRLPAGDSPADIQLGLDTDFELRLAEQTLAISRLNINAPKLQHAGRQLSMDAKTLAAGNLRTGQYLLDGFSASGNFSDPAIGEKAIAYRLDTDLELDLSGQKLTATNMRLATDDLKAGGMLNADWGRKQPSASGTIAVPEVALRTMLERFGITVPKTRNSKAFSRASLSSRFYADPGQLKLEGLKASLDSSTINGQLRVRDFKQPKISYQLAVDKLDADAYLAPKQKGAPPLAIAALPVDTIRSLNIDGRMDIGQLRYSGLKLSKVQVGVKAAKGLLQFKPLQASLGEGRYQGHLQVDARKAATRVSLDEQLKNIDLHALLSTLGIDTGVLNLRGGRSDLRLRGQFSANASGQQLLGRKVAFDGRIAGRVFKGGPLKVAIRSDLDLDLGAKTLALDHLDAAIAELRTTGSLRASQLDSKPQFDASLKVTPFNPRKLAARLGVRIPRTADKKVLRALSMETRIKGTADSLQAAPLRIGIDGSTLKGNLTIAGVENPAIVFDLGMDTLNLDRYLPPQRKTKAATPGAIATVLPLYLIRNLNLNGKLQVGKFKVSGLAMKNVRITARAKDGRLHLSPLGANLYQGSYQGNIDLDVTKQQPQLKVNEIIKNVRIGKLLRDLNGKSPPLTGATSIHATLTSAGADTGTMKKNLNGKLDFSIQNGTLEKVDLVNSMCKALAAIDLGNLNKQSIAAGLIGLIAASQSKSSAASSSGTGNTRFTDLHGSSRINNGIASSDDLLMTSPVVKLTGAGKVNIPANSINYLAKAELVQNCAGIGKRDLTGQQIPVQISGPLDDPKVSPQLTAGLVNALRGKQTQRSSAQQPATIQQQAAPEQPVKRGTQIKNTRDKVIKGLLEGLFKSQ